MPYFFNLQILSEEDGLRWIFQKRFKGSSLHCPELTDHHIICDSKTVGEL